MAKQDMYKAFEDVELTEGIVVVAKFTANDTEYVSKRLCAFYPEHTNKDRVANQGLKLVYQRQIREARQSKEGLKKVSTGGKAVDLSAIEAV